MTAVLQNPAPLQTNYLPPEFVNRTEEQQQLDDLFSQVSSSSRNLHLHGPRGNGKTHLTQLGLNQLSSQVNTCYVPCSRFDTQYKALKQVYRHVTNEDISDGYHTSDLQRRIEERTQATKAVIVLDEIEFLLLNDGDNLLYYLSRIDNKENISLITISTNHPDLKDHVEERTYSSLHPQRIHFEPYSEEAVYRILVERAQSSLAEQSLHRDALTHIASQTQNVALGLHWLRTAAENTDTLIKESLVHEVRPQAVQSYAQEQLEPFTEHHRLLYQSIQELATETASVIQSGPIYSRYKELSQSYSETPLSNRRISDFLKHLELLNLIQADYHYGGSKGKTREIQIHEAI